MENSVRGDFLEFQMVHLIMEKGLWRTPYSELGVARQPVPFFSIQTLFAGIIAEIGLTQIK